MYKFLLLHGKCFNAGGKKERQNKSRDDLEQVEIQYAKENEKKRKKKNALFYNKEIPLSIF